MVSEINGSPLNIVKSVDQSATKVDATQGANPTATTPTANGDAVSLTDLAARLQELTKAVENIPAVDQQKVDEFRSAIESGNYQVDAEAVAEKLNAIENMLGVAKQS